MPDPNIVEGIHNAALATGNSLSRVAESIEFNFDWTITSAHIALAASQGPCLAHVEINPSGVDNQTTVLKTQWIRGSSVSGGTGQLQWFGAVPLKNGSRLFGFVRNDTGAAVTTSILWTGHRFPPVVRDVG